MSTNVSKCRSDATVRLGRRGRWVPASHCWRKPAVAPTVRSQVLRFSHLAICLDSAKRIASPGIRSVSVSGLSAITACLALTVAARAQLPAVVELSTLDGSSGFSISGFDAFDRRGFSVSGAGDVNGDGIDDLIVGAPNADPKGLIDAGASYIVLGQNTQFAASINLSDLNGTNGFAVNGLLTRA